MTEALTLTTIARTSLVTLTDVRCAELDDTRRTEHAEWHQVVLPRRGTFTLLPRRPPGRRTVADVNRAILLNRGDAYAVEHPVGGGDVCTVLTAVPAVLDEVLGGAVERPFGSGARDVDPATDLLHRSLVARLRAGARPSSLEVDETALAMLAAVARRRTVTHRPAASAAHRRLAAAAQERLNGWSARDVSLGTVAHDLAVSPFHLSRTFRAVTGVPMHRYLVRLRLRHGVERLLADEGSVTGIAHDLGFADHSHFTHSVRRELGLTPTAIRRLAKPD